MSWTFRSSSLHGEGMTHSKVSCLPIFFSIFRCFSNPQRLRRNFFPKLALLRRKPRAFSKVNSLDTLYLSLFQNAYLNGTWLVMSFVSPFLGVCTYPLVIIFVRFLGPFWSSRNENPFTPADELNLDSTGSFKYEPHAWPWNFWDGLRLLDFHIPWKFSPYWSHA